MSRRIWVWLVVVLALGALSAAIVRAVGARRVAAPATAASAVAAVVELAPLDVVRVATAELASTLPVSGGLKAVNSAVVKAKVAAEVKELLVREGDRVAAGQLIGRLDDTEFQWRLRQAEDQAAAAQAQLEIAERTLANNKALVDQGFISKTALDTSVSSANGARASLQAAKAAAEIARKSVRDAELRAPLAGLVSQRLAQPGERVPVDARLLEIVDLSRIELEAAVPPEDVVSLRVGQTATVQVDGLPQAVAARVARINPATQSGSRAVMVYLAVDPHPALRHGLFARGQVELERQRALVLPASAVRTEQARPAVLVAAAGRVLRREVQLGARGQVDFGAGTEAAQAVVSGLAEGDVVLRGSVGNLPDGTALRLPAARQP
ncbi:MAG: efflux RND transporter periplasmic adaptor subunit [Rubrivivax sp.]|nr:efflux RND transporter periplasmic adaptor subunit [Rubrivivax sp.]